jgi:hypothetical protein
MFFTLFGNMTEERDFKFCKNLSGIEESAKGSTIEERDSQPSKEDLFNIEAL